MMLEHLESIQSVAVVGATGLVGTEFLSILAEHKIKFSKMKFLASSESAGESIEFDGVPRAVEELDKDSFRGIEVAFFSVPRNVTERFVPIAVSSGTLVVDDSSVYRMNKDVPLIVPEVNGSLLREFTRKILSTPNCTTTPLALVLKPLQDAFGLERVTVSTYQSVSGAGREANEELSRQVIQLLNGAAMDEPRVFPRQIAFNCLPQIGSVGETGESEEELKITRETRKILGLPKLRIGATAVRVPTFCGHGLSVGVEFEQDFESVEQVRGLLDSFAGVKVIDNPASQIYPINLDCIGDNSTFVGRIRRDFSVRSGVNLWIIADNLRKGAALNALQILETLYRYRSMS